jgi:acyl dehydratase
VTVDQLTGIIGQEMVSPWREVTQDQITQFADITGDKQWIHVDADRAARESSFGGTIAHGFFTLALTSRLLRDAVGSIDGARMGINYGLNKVRFPAPVPSGSRIRATFTVQSVEEVPGGEQAVTLATVECERGDKPVCVAELVSRMIR